MRTMTFMTLFAAVAAAHRNDVWSHEQQVAAGYKEHVVSPLPHTYVTDVPASFTWGDVNGTSYLTKSLNQHIPQYCGSCWAHGAVSALGDRIKIARKAKGIDVNLAVQHVLNCGNAGSCHGGGAGAVYAWIKSNKDGIVYDTCNPYLACSSESEEGFCKDVDTTCKAENVCRTCSTFTADGGKCVAIAQFPNVTIAEHGIVYGAEKIMAEIYARGPVAGGIDANQILNYQGGIAKAKCGGIDHVISIVGFGTDGATPYWIIRNSWGEYWGEMGYFRISRAEGEDACTSRSAYWATFQAFTEHNVPCDEDGSNCLPKTNSSQYVDPSFNKIPLGAAM
ncbi:Gut-specific cysteine proteinase [Diplonema papillatum]|nr:Gut-specific cysteine proteinase [Diplonema papillatum]KAJ9463791.1 Gut-specific cysteine proteinase [Diplonema papillatum]